MNSSKNRTIMLSLMLAGIASMVIAGVGVASVNAANNSNKDINVHFDIKVKSQPGDKGAKGDKGDKGESIIGPAGPAGINGNDSTVPGPQGPMGFNGSDSIVPGPIGPVGPAANLTINICQVGTSNCVSENASGNDTLTIFVNATGNVVNDNGTVPVPEPVVCQPGTHNENDVCVDDVVIPPINDTNTGNTTDTGNVTDTNSTG
jgi:hypothetical protein